MIAVLFMHAQLELHGLSQEAVSEVWHAWIVMPMLALLLFVVSGVIGYLVGRRSQLKGMARQPNALLSADSSTAVIPDWVPIGAPCRWLVVRDVPAAQVQSTLGVASARTCTLQESLDYMQQGGLFIATAAGHWTMVWGQGLPDPADDVDHCHRFLAGLSKRLGYVQFYSVYPALCQHAWARLYRGHVLRAYAWNRHTMWNQGPMTRAEKDAGLVCFEYGESNVNSPPVMRDAGYENIEGVFRLAARWGVAPRSLPLRQPGRLLGITGA